MAENLLWLESERALLFSDSHVRTKGLALVLISIADKSCHPFMSRDAVFPRDLAVSSGYRSRALPFSSPQKAPVRVRAISTLLPFLDRRIG